MKGLVILLPKAILTKIRKYSTRKYDFNLRVLKFVEYNSKLINYSFLPGAVFIKIVEKTSEESDFSSLIVNRSNKVIQKLFCLKQFL